MNGVVEDKRLNLVLKSAFWVLAITLGALQTWHSRYFIWPDGPSYLDIADNYLSGNWDAAINACWSPLYSWILGAALFVFQPSPYQELLLVKSVNFTIYLLTLVSFDFFLSQLMVYAKNHQKLKEGKSALFEKPDWMWISIGYTIFIWSSVVWLLVHRDTPDMVVACLLYLATAFVLRVSMNPSSWHNYFLLGVFLGLSYLAKSFMLPLGIIFILSVIHRNNRISLKNSLFRASLSLLLMLLFALPFITAISLQKHRITIGDAGRLNYAWYVSPRIAPRFWQGIPPEAGIPVHPTRVINKKPEIQEFATPVSGSYPPWYDPSYWNEGIQPKFVLEKQIDVIVKNLVFLSKPMLIFLLLFFLLLASVSEKRIVGFFRNILYNWRFFLPSVLGLVSFISFTILVVYEEPWVTWQERYIAPFIVLLVLFAFLSADIKSTVFTRKVLKGLVIAAVILVNTTLLFHPALSMSTIKYPAKGKSHYHWEFADNLKKMGVKAGDKVAVLGQGDGDLYWARLATVKIVAAMSLDYLSSSGREKDVALNALKKLGVSAVVRTPFSPWNSDKCPGVGWRKIGKTNSYLYKF